MGFFLQSILLIVGIILTLLVYRRLTRWWIEYRKWEREQKEHHKEDKKVELVGQPAPELSAFSVGNNKIFNIKQIKRDTILVFLDIEMYFVVITLNFLSITSATIQSWTLLPLCQRIRKNKLINIVNYSRKRLTFT